MENTELKLNGLIADIKALQLESMETKHMHKKHENYNKGALLIAEAKKCLDKLQEEIKNLQLVDVSKNDVRMIDQLIDLLDVPNPKITEILYVVTQLKSFESIMPTKAHITNDIQNEIIHIDQNDDFN